MIVSPEKAAEIIAEGGVVIYPTETVYGLGGDAFNPSVAERIREIKKRKDEKFIILVGSFEDIWEISEEVSPIAERLIETFWPGPLTLIFPVRKSFFKFFGRTVAIRISPHPVVKKILGFINVPLISTSANISGEKPISSLAEVKNLFGKKVDAIVEGEPWGELPSTIYDPDSDIIIREGSISIDSIKKSLWR